MSRARGLFVTGTDTGVGKTVVACALVRGLRARGVDTGAMKPVETGVGAEGPVDALALRAAAGDADPIGEVCPQHFRLPAAPSIAARAEGTEVDLDRILEAFARLAARHECVITEGAGGLLVPLTAGTCMADLALRLAMPAVVVARAALGTINHTLLTLEVAETRGLPVAGVVISHGAGPLSDADARNLDALREALGRRLVGEVPPLGPGADPPEGSLDLAAIW